MSVPTSEMITRATVSLTPGRLQPVGRLQKGRSTSSACRSTFCTVALSASICAKRQRVLRGHTRDPRPRCNTAADERWGRPKGAICDEGKHLIATGKDAIRQRRERSERTYQWARRPHWWPQCYGPYQFGRSGTRTRLANAMFDLVQTVTTRVDCEDTWAGYDGTLFVSAERKTRESLNDLDAAIRNALADAYAEGNARGQRSLPQLACGDMSLSDFDKRTIRRQEDE